MIGASGERLFSHSSLQSYKDCPLKFYYEYEVGIKKIEDEASEHHLRFGNACHATLESLYLGGSVSEAMKGFKELYPVQLDQEDKAKTVENWETVLNRHFPTVQDDLKRWKVLSVEKKESFGLVEEGFTAKLDLVMENLEYGGVYGFDHKIVGGRKATLSYDFWTQFEPNSQVTKYVSYIKEKYGDCSGFYINAFGMGYRLRAYKGEPSGFHWKHERQMFNRNEQQLEDDRIDTEYWIARVRESRASGKWGMNTSNCRFCQFRPICASGWNWRNDQELILIQYQLNDAQDIGKEKKDADGERGSVEKN